MAGSVYVPATLESPSAEFTAVAAQSIPWYIWCNVLAITCSVIGGVWDISWHESIGRDTFWTPAHILIQLCGVLSGLGCGYLILSTTFRRDSPLRDHSVSVWTFRGPLGGFLCAWGSVAMIASAPFDNYWHNAYGLDVKILSPPHILLALGLIAIRFGTLVMVLAELNHAVGEYRAKLERILYFCFLFLVGMAVGIMQEKTNRVFMHGASFYLVVMFVAPIWMAAVVRASKHPWAATIMTGLYTCVHLFFTWSLQLVPAQPKLGPVYQKITHLIPPEFPLLLIVPAVVFDLVRRRTGTWKPWAQSTALGTSFFASFFAAQWPFANFLMSSASRNWFFSTTNYPYFIKSDSYWVRNLFVPTESSSAQFAIRLVMALLVAVLMTRLGTVWGNWMSSIRR